MEDSPTMLIEGDHIIYSYRPMQPYKRIWGLSLDMIRNKLSCRLIHLADSRKWEKTLVAVSNTKLGFDLLLLIASIFVFAGYRKH